MLDVMWLALATCSYWMAIVYESKTIVHFEQCFDIIYVIYTYLYTKNTYYSSPPM